MLTIGLLGGLVLLVVGGDVLVRGAVAVARIAGISPLVIGLTLVGFGTSTPELLASVQAALIGAPAIAVGNVVGSNIVNVLLIMGLAALLSPVAADAPGVRRDMLVMGVATVAAAGLLLWGTISRPVGAALLAALVAYTVGTILADRRDGAMTRIREEEAHLKESPQVHLSLWPALGLTVGGLVGVMLGARFLVDAAVELATRWGVSQSLIGVTVVAVGTSLPELVTSVVAAVKKESDVALGNIVGSNIFNILGILGTTALMGPISVPQEIVARDTWVLLASSLALVGVVLALRNVPRALGFVFVVGYGVYIAGLVGGLPELSELAGISS
jgi:cation:H+ antiporter